MKRIFAFALLVMLAQPSAFAARGPAQEAGPFSAQLAAFRDEAEAQALVDEVAAKQGIEARIQEVTVPGKGRWFRVLAGSFATRRDAEIYVQEKDLRTSFPQVWIRPMEGVVLAPVRAAPKSEAKAVATATAETAAPSEKPVVPPAAPAPAKEPVYNDAPVTAPPPEEHPWLHAHVGYGLDLHNISQSGDWGSLDERRLDLHHITAHVGTHRGVLPGGLQFEGFVVFQPTHLAGDTSDLTHQSLSLFDFGAGLKYRGFLLSFEGRQQAVARFLTSTTLEWNKFFFLGPALGYDLTLLRSAPGSGGWLSDSRLNLRAKVGLPLLNASASTLAARSPSGYVLNAELQGFKGIGVAHLEAGFFVDFTYRNTSFISALTGSDATVRNNVWNLAFGLSFGGAF